MKRSLRRLFLLIGSIPILILLVAILYMMGMRYLENQPRSFLRALGWAAETLTTTGYGLDSVWGNPLMVGFVIVVQFSGVFLVYMVFPVYIIPFLEERFETRLPKAVTKWREHVVIFGYGPAVTSLIEELSYAGVKSLVVEEDQKTCRKLMERGIQVIVGDLDSNYFQGACVMNARALIANASDDDNAAFILAVRQDGFEGDILALTEEAYHRKPLALAGATAVYTPRHMLGAALAARASTKINNRISGLQQLGENVQLAEIRIQLSSALAGKTLIEAQVGAKTGACIIGQWINGHLHTQPTAEMRIEPFGILVAVGGEESIRRLTQLAGGRRPFRRNGHFVIGGYGEVGRKVEELLAAFEEEVLVVEKQPGKHVGVQGDVLDLHVLKEARVNDAQAVILALNTDSATLFATVVIKDFAPDVPVIARVNQAINVERIYRAGADFALSISQVSGQVHARRLLGEETIAIDPQLKLLRVSSKGFEGKHPFDLHIRERTGASVVAVERGSEVLPAFSEHSFRFGPDDVVYLCGSTKAIHKFNEIFPTEH